MRIFKGIPLSMVPGATLRDLGDIDLLVAEKDVYRAGDILRARMAAGGSTRKPS